VRTWRDDALCLGMDSAIFFAESRTPEDAVLRAKAKRICRACPVARVCLEDADRVERGRRAGIRGGLTGDARVRRVAKVKAALVAAA